MKKYKLILVVSLFLNLVFISAAGFVIYKKGGINFLKKQVAVISNTQEYPNYYLQKKDIFETIKPTKVEKVFVGDSITDHGEFQEYFPDEVVLNRGISNDNSKGVLNRIEETLDRNPDQVYLMIGVNDILYSTNIEDYKNNIIDVVESFEERDTEVYLQSILPVNNEIYGDAINNETVKEFNNVLKAVADEKGIHYIDLHSKFQDENGQLKKEFTIDGIHLNGKGYETWIENL